MLPLQLQPESHIPLYVQLCDQLRGLMHTGDLRPGDRIPASRELAQHLGVHRTTVANAYAELESEGLIQGHVGRGTFVLARRAALGAAPPPSPAPPTSNGGVRWESLFADERGEEGLDRFLRDVPSDGVSFVIALPPQDFFPLDELRQCCATVLRREGSRILQLGATDGYPQLRRALVDLLRAEGLALGEENLLVTDGCQQAMDLLCKAFVRPGDAVLHESPGYPGAIAILNAARARCLGVPVRTEAGGPAGLDVSAVEATLAANRVKMMVLTPDFQNPTGTCMPIAERRRLLELAARYQVPIVEDHIYARLRVRGEKIPSLKELDRSNVVVQIDSFSKVAFPGLRVGWMVAPANVIGRLRLAKQPTDLHTDQLSQAMLAEFTRRGMLGRHLARMRKVYAVRLAAVLDALERHMPAETRWTRPEGGMCVWVELPAGFDANELLLRARERGVLFAPGRYFYNQGPRPNALRLGFAGVDEKRIAKGVGVLGELLRAELRKRQRGGRRFESGGVALV